VPMEWMNEFGMSSSIKLTAVCIQVQNFWTQVSSPVTVCKRKPHLQCCIDTNVSSHYFACLIVCISQQHLWHYVQISYSASYSNRSIDVGSKGKGKAVPLQAWSGPEGSRNLRFPDFMTTAQDGGKVVSLTHRPP
jgi:hypothetical protein